ncbi:MAG TPA: hypothetical protein VLA97_13655 [Nocardioidaceae bacterium]|nr:hypothetical protein [Nocardioidaceae bacterium]HSE71801.1 hypothetical protein [Nocardioidaceae bacterium]
MTTLKAALAMTLAPIRSTALLARDAVAKVLHHAPETPADPTVVRRYLAEVDELRWWGHISDEDALEVSEQLVRQLQRDSV